MWSEMFQGNQKLQFYFNGDHCSKVTVKKYAKIIIFHVLSHKSITTWASEISVQYRFLGLLSIRNISYLSSICCNFWEKCINSHKICQGCSTPLRIFRTANTLNSAIKWLQLTVGSSFPVILEQSKIVSLPTLG